jgi:serine/threonine-protein kinase
MAESDSSRVRRARLHRALLAHRDESIGRLAVERGLISEERLEQFIREAGRRTLGEALVEAGVLGRAQLDELIEQGRRRGASERNGGDAPEEVRALMADPARRLSEYVLVARLGEGGAAEVWKAWDCNLKRWVAIKRPHGLGDSPVSSERFKREALAAAKLSHPNIVSIYRIAEEQGRPYIVMQLVEGRTLAELRLGLDEALKAMRSAALAVHHAHEQGVIHRDLKPENFMLDGHDRLWVLDFGLAHFADASRSLTASGTVLGTPAFMSPEQARGEGETHSPLTDVYSLGATLYELTVGRAPFDGRSMAEVVRKVSDDDPPRPKKINRQLPGEVETIILKAMEKDPRRRYPTARDFAEDIRRHLEGEPISARPVSVAYRVVRSVRRRPVVTALSAVLLLSTGLAAGVLLPGWMEERQRFLEQQQRTRDEQIKAEQARRETLEVIRMVAGETKEAILEMRRRGEAVHPARRAMGRVLTKAYEKAVEAAPQDPEPHYLMGRVERAQMRDAEALKYQDRALAVDTSYAPARYERVVLVSREYDRELEILRVGLGIADPGGIAEIEKSDQHLAKLRQRLEEECSRLEERLPELGDAVVLCARGILAARRGKTEEGRELLLKARAADPTLEEAFETLAQIEADVNEKEARYTEGLKHDAGYLGHLYGRAAARISRGLGKIPRKEDPEEDFKLGLEDCARAVELGPEFAGGWAMRGLGRAGLGNYKARRNADALEDFVAGESDMSQALELDGSAFRVLQQRSAARFWIAHINYERGNSPEEWYRKGLEDVDLALSRRPDDPPALLLRGRTLYNLSFQQKDKRLDLLNKAEADLSKLIQLKTDSAEGHMLRGILRVERGLPDIDSEDVRSGEADLKRAIELKFPRGDAWECLGKLHGKRGNNASGTGRTDEYRQALECFDKAVDAGPTPRNLHYRAVTRLNLSEAVPKEAEEHLRMAERDETRAIELSGRDSIFWQSRGNIRWALAQLLERAGKPAGSAFGLAADDYERAIKLKPALESQLRGRITRARANSDVEH